MSRSSWCDPWWHRFDRDCHAARTGQSLRGQGPSSASSKLTALPLASATLLQYTYPTFTAGSSLAVARGTPATTHWHRRGAGMGRRGVGDSAGMARSARTGRTTWCEPCSRPWHTCAYAAYPPWSRLDPHDGDARRSHWGWIGAWLLGGCLDTTQPDLGHKRAELSAGSEGDVYVQALLRWGWIWFNGSRIHLHGWCSALSASFIRAVSDHLKPRGYSTGVRDGSASTPTQPLTES